MNKNKFALIIFVVILTTFITAIFSVVFVYPMLDKKETIVEKNIESSKTLDEKKESFVKVSSDEYDKLLEVYEKYKKIDALEEFVLDNYYKDVEELDFMSFEIKGMFEALEDPYSQYFTSEEFKLFNEEINGEYEGIGVVVAPGEDSLITVVSPISESPGFEAGLKTNDKILKVDGIKYTSDQLTEAVMNIRGPAESTVILTVLRDEKELDIPVVRRKIKLDSVISKVLENKIGYIRIASFDKDVAKEFKINLDKLEEEGIESLILDLRYNGGGYLDQCLEITDELLGEGIIVKTKDNKGNIVLEKSDSNKIDYPLVVLVNEGSASASEILTGAVKDHEEGTIIGTTTFGKGLVQRVLPLSMFDNSGFKITVEQYFTPNDNYIHGIGIEPNIVIEDDPSTKKDEQLEKAIEVLTK